MMIFSYFCFLLACVIWFVAIKVFSLLFSLCFVKRQVRPLKTQIRQSGLIRQSGKSPMGFKCPLFLHAEH